MLWQDEGYLLNKNNFDENSIIIEVFTLNHGKYSGVVYGGASRKQKRNFQIGNKLSLNWTSKSVNRNGYFNVELLKPVSPLFFDSKERSICLLSAAAFLKILLPERQINRKIYNSFEILVDKLKFENWINFYIKWELQLIKELGFDIDLSEKNDQIGKLNQSIIINGKNFKIPKILLSNNNQKISKNDIRDALLFNKSLFIENFINPNHLKFPLHRNILSKYCS